jgi:hypothetical protein
MRLTTPTMSVEAFINRWRWAQDIEIATYQTHFANVCAIIGHVAPYEEPQLNEDFRYEYVIKKLDGGSGRADVFYRGHFAVEYKQKGKYRTLHAAYKQLNEYRESLGNPPLLVVCDIEHWEIHTNFTGTDKKIYQFTNEDIRRPEIYHLLQDLFSDPTKLHPNLHSEDVTKSAAANFRDVAEYLEKTRGLDGERIARFVTQLVFSMFAEDIRLLPSGFGGQKGILTEILESNSGRTMQIQSALLNLFNAMRDGGSYHTAKIEYFNGSVFENVEVHPLDEMNLARLARASSLNWSHVEPSIFGTLFERVLKKSERRKLGAHYTSADDIKRIVEPVLMQPLRRAWEAARSEATPIRGNYETAITDRDRHNAALRLDSIRQGTLKQVRDIKVLDPACGSGNFLYISLRLLLDLEQEIIQSELWEGLRREDIQVTPTQLYGMEIDPIAHALASIVVWIGYLQWKYEHRYPLTVEVPILSDLSETNIRRMDAILAYDADGNPIEPEWVEADVIVGNPPFLGGKRIRSELGQVVDDLFRLYADRVPPEADLVCYWFEKARAQIEMGKTKRAGLLATNSIRGGANRAVLDRVKETGDIFMAWSDREWILEGAAVRISIVGFDDGLEADHILDGAPVYQINADLQNTIDATKARSLHENTNLAFMGITPAGSFDISEEQARVMLAAVNASGQNNADVVRPYLNAMDIVQQPRNAWTIDFGTEMSEAAAARYEAPFAHVQAVVKPIRARNNRKVYRDNWWLYAESRPAMRRALKPLTRYIATPLVSKHRIFVWLDPHILPSNSVDAIVRDDDYFFGVLHSLLHERWSLRLGTWLGKGNDPRYTPTTTFETFPFPFTPGKEDFSDPRIQAIGAAAKQLHEEREAWLTSLEGGTQKDRTLTNLYNALQSVRGTSEDKAKPKPVALAFAPRLNELHNALDVTVCAAYGWDASILQDDEAMLRDLLMLNLARATAHTP